ncbi:MAG: histidinol dehydrogenase [Vampirovibrionales bacterium]
MIPILSPAEVSAWLKANTLKQIRRNTWQAFQAKAQTVSTLIERVQHEGDHALISLAHEFHEPHPDWILIPPDFIHQAIQAVPDELKEAIQYAVDNVRRFAEAQKKTLAECFTLEREGFQVGAVTRPIERVACYIPGGSHPLPSTAIMTLVPAKVAGVPHVVACTPSPDPAILMICHVLGIKTIYRMGGAQAIAALTFGTETVEPVDLIVGPGNAYVTEAKRQLQGMVGIDLIAGPSDVTIIADTEADAESLALDLLAQAEHGADSEVCLITPDETLARRVNEFIAQRHEELELPDFLKESLTRSHIMLVESLDQAVEVANVLAPEHLMLQVRDTETLRPKLTHYGALFVGYHSTVAHGDYAAGPNHTLPTSRTARFSSGLNVHTFLRHPTFVEVDTHAYTLHRQCETLAAYEGLTAHAGSVFIRKL